MPLIEEFLPDYQFREWHSRVLPVAPAVANACLRDVDLARSPLIGPLFALRSVPARLRNDPAAEVLRVGRLGDFFDRAFVTLRDDPPRGLVVGAIGEFWRAAGGVRRFAPSQFAELREPGTARLAWAFEFEALPAGRCRAVTETRIACVDAAALRRMRLYWWLIRPASGLIRRETLRLLARQCSDRVRRD